jgi:hypothetical protein
VAPAAPYTCMRRSFMDVRTQPLDGSWEGAEVAAGERSDGPECKQSQKLSTRSKIGSHAAVLLCCAVLCCASVALAVGTAQEGSPLQNCLLTPESQWQPRGKWRILRGSRQARCLPVSPVCAAAGVDGQERELQQHSPQHSERCPGIVRADERHVSVARPEIKLADEVVQMAPGLGGGPP